MIYIKKKCKWQRLYRGETTVNHCIERKAGYLQFFLISVKQNRVCAPYIYMKTNLFRLAVVVLALQQASCGDPLSPRYVLEFPQAPEPWVSLLGEPHWRVEWLDPDGRRQTADVLPGYGLEVELPATWTNPVAAWPYWPGLSLFEGLFMPAGALFPFDAGGNRLYLSWRAGPDAVFYNELSSVRDSAKNPANFDWLRFRELFQSESLNKEVIQDPWLVDWRSVAEKTAGANFDRRRLVPQTASSVKIPVSAGPWYGASPFASPLTFAEGEPPSFPVRPGLNVWVCREGILRVNGKTWIFTAKLD